MTLLLSLEKYQSSKKCEYINVFFFTRSCLLYYLSIYEYINVIFLKLNRVYYSKNWDCLFIYLSVYIYISIHFQTVNTPLFCVLSFDQAAIVDRKG